MLKFYYSAGACSLAAHIVLQESGLPYQAIRVDLAKGEQRTPEYLRIHPLGRVPVLLFEDGEALTENTAILPYLGKRFGLWPKDDRAEARALSIIGFFATGVHPVFAHIGRASRYAHEDACQRHIAEVARATVLDYLREADALLEGREWFGDRYSVLDPYGFFFFNWATRKSGVPLGELKNYSAFYERMLARTAVTQVLEQEGVPAW